ncbi:hypothetical protein RQP53_10625 [Paucibacter sp. APW11]|uniref:Uncharacterized protein n=1 Tax=Roseateles aquae TaxID=3077235 RepID=A0ABU3PAW3_9BURK|nr:hypothetical protein [Paucibacter sp. APW11]MDT8999721.1 hypothetical protein [Paucibacter sp. APW11]
MDGAAIAVLALCVLQLAGAWAVFSGRSVFARRAALICPAAMLALALLQLGGWAWHKERGPLLAVEQALLLALLLALALALLQGRRGGSPLTLADRTLWLLNSTLCAAFVYLRFFFRLF